MLEKISDVPDSVLGFRTSGELTGDDYRNVLVPAVEAGLQSRDKLRLLYLLGDDVTGFSAGAAWQDAKAGMEHVTRWEKIAVVTDKEWIRHSVNIFGYLIPGRSRPSRPQRKGTPGPGSRADLSHAPLLTWGGLTTMASPRRSWAMAASTRGVG
jgi:stage II sporulation SpoAA-like protein